MSQGEFVQSRMEIVRIRLRLYMALSAYRKPLCDSLRAA